MAAGIAKAAVLGAGTTGRDGAGIVPPPFARAAAGGRGFLSGPA
jgi:hypothetical protein